MVCGSPDIHCRCGKLKLGCGAQGLGSSLCHFEEGTVLVEQSRNWKAPGVPAMGELLCVLMKTPWWQ